MSSVLVQFRIEDTAKAKATSINDIPRNRGLEAMKEASRIATMNGISEMTLEEINAEINAKRDVRHYFE